MMPASINVEQYEPQIRQLARSVKNRYELQLSIDELCSAAYEALLAIVDAGTYDPSCGEFWPYVYKKLRGAMIDEVENLGRPRRQRALYKLHRDAVEASHTAEVKSARDMFFEAMAFTKSTAVAYATWLESENLQRTPEADFIANEEVQQLLECVERLPEHYRAMIRQRYLEEVPLKEIAEELGITEQRASQKMAQAKTSLRRDLSDSPSPVVPSPPRSQFSVRAPAE